jgi:hypothetical protein
MKVEFSWLSVTYQVLAVISGGCPGAAAMVADETRMLADVTRVAAGRHRDTPP